MKIRNIIKRIRHYAHHLPAYLADTFDFRILRAKRVGQVFEEIHLKRFLKEFEIDCVFDVGANYGQYAQMLRKIGYRGHIISFEPIPSAQKVLKSLSATDPKWHIEPIALDSSTGQRTFSIMKGDQFSSFNKPSSEEISLFAEDNKVIEEIPVITETLSAAYEKHKKLHGFHRPFLKMDTQGNDLSIAKGSGAVLPAFVGLQSELSIKRIYSGTEDFRKAIEYYNSQGFELSAFVPNNEGHFPHLVEIDCIMYNKKFIR